MTLIATVTVDAIDEAATADGGVVVRAIASGSDAISTNTEGEVSKIEILLHCPAAPGLKVGDTLTLSTHFVKSDPNAPTTPANAVGPEATEPESEPEPTPASDAPAVPVAASPEAVPDAEPVAASEPSSDTTTPAEPQPTNPDGTPIPAPDASALDTSVPADGSALDNPGAEVTDGQNADPAADPNWTDPAAAEAAPATPEVPPVS